jgi:hypothetical protein
MAEQEVRVKSTPMFKLKDGRGRSWQGIHLRKQFGFVPDVIIVEKMPGQNNRIVIRAVLTEEEIKKEDIRLKADEKERAKVKKMLESAVKAKK